MTAITPQLVKELRERTGVGMAKCKEALDHSQGNMEEAIAYLRKAGMASAVKKEGRETKEGAIFSFETPTKVSFVEVNAETDFVVKNEKFQAFGLEMAKEAAHYGSLSLDAFMKSPYLLDPSITIDQARSLLIQMIGENIQVRKVLVVDKAQDLSVGVYSHLGGKIVTAIVMKGSGEEKLARDIAMHVAAAAPEYLSKEEVPEAVLNNEKEIAKGQVPPGKPPFVVEKIIEGKLKSFFDTACLLHQKYIRDDSMTVEEFVKKQTQAKPAQVIRFIRWMVGQG